jgi:predicted dehydrogenase
MNTSHTPAAEARRGFLKSAGAAALTANIFTGRIFGANDRIVAGFIGMGEMGMGNLRFAMRTEKVQVAAVCDVFQPHLEAALETAKKGGFEAKGYKDFREVLADKSIDAVCISTPDHWHALMTVEACKAGKDVFVEKPACVYADEGPKMIQAARKYKRVVQGGTMQRSGGYFKKAAELVQAGELGDITFCHAWQAGLARQEGYGNPPDDTPPGTLDWEMWLGPAPRRPFNANRFGVAPKRWATFRYFWDYAGGAMTDWGVHLIDPMHQCLGDTMPKAIVALGDRFYVKDNLETPDTMLATFQYEKFLGSYESRTCNPTPMFGHGAGTSIHGTKGTLVFHRGGLWFTPIRQPGREPMVWEKDREMSQLNIPHWLNFLDCMRTREKPISDIENCVRSSVTCILANLSMRFRSRIDWDEKNWTVSQGDIRPHLKANYRRPWKLEV